MLVVKNKQPVSEICYVRAGSPSCTSMDVHVGSPPHSGCMVVAQAFGQGVTLEASVPDDKVLGPKSFLYGFMQCAVFFVGLKVARR